MKLKGFSSKYCAINTADRRICAISSVVQDLAIKRSSFVKKKNAPEAPPSVNRSLIVFINDLIASRQTDRQKQAKKNNGHVRLSKQPHEQPYDTIGRRVGEEVEGSVSMSMRDHP